MRAKPTHSAASAVPKKQTFGFVDGFIGTSVRGWAVSGSGLPVTITVRDAHGRTVAKGTTGEHRPDVARLGHPEDCGFLIPIRRLRASSILHVFAGDREATGSPVAFGPGNYDGALSVDDGVASGWISERSERFAGALIELKDQDGNLLGACEAGCKPEAGGPLAVQARFSTPLAYPAYGRDDLIVRAYAGGMRFAEVHTALRLDGYLDLLTAEQAGGWLICPEAPLVPLEIEVFRDNTRIGAGRCQLPREDVRDRYPRNWRVGFHIPFAPPPPGAAPDAPHVYSFRLAGTGVELFEGPFVIEERDWAVAAARRIGRWGRREAALNELDRAVLDRALAGFLAQRRLSAERPRRPLATVAGELQAGRRRLNIVIPVYRDRALTQICIESVLATRDPTTDAVILVNDCSPDPGMAEMLAAFAAAPDVYVLTNAENRGFVHSANRGMAFCRRGDVLLLNSDTRVFPGVIDELCAVARSSADIGTVTALSNNATIFSYPHPDLPHGELADMSWPRIAQHALEANRGAVFDVPTGHGFCMLIRREVLGRIGLFDEGFGRGYGEENDFCQRAADLGYRNVAAAGAFVEHRESVSFAEERHELIARNLRRLGGVYPEYAAAISAFERGEGLRRARWPIDAARLRAASAKGAEFALVITNWLAGGARKALQDFESVIGYGPARRLRLTVRQHGLMELESSDPLLRAVFGAGECEELFDLLGAARISRVLIHQVLGFPPDFADHLGRWVRGRQAIYYAHDYYPLCPRVTLIDAAGTFCRLAAPDVCTRCVAAAGPHEAARLPLSEIATHRARMGRLLDAVSQVVVPSESAAAYYRQAWPELAIVVAPHPEPAPAQAPVRRPMRLPGEPDEVVLLGAIGPHKGSAKLLELARRARLSHPDLRFRVIGYTDIDADLRALGNVVITGSFEPGELPRLAAEGSGWIALFLHLWPETWSYTLSEAAGLGLVPLVSDLGAPAERVRQAGVGRVFPFPIDPASVLAEITAMLADGPPTDVRAAAFVRPDAASIHRKLLGLADPPPPSTEPLRRRKLRSRAAEGSSAPQPAQTTPAARNAAISAAE